MLLYYSPYFKDDKFAEELYSSIINVGATHIRVAPTFNKEPFIRK